MLQTVIIIIIEGEKASDLKELEVVTNFVTLALNRYWQGQPADFAGVFL